MEGNIHLIALSFILNYSVVIMLSFIFLIFRIYNKFSLAFTIAYLIEVSLFVIGLFLKYIRSNIILIKNPIVNTILIFSGETVKISSSYYMKILILHSIIIIILITIYNYLLLKRREIND